MKTSEVVTVIDYNRHTEIVEELTEAYRLMQEYAQNLEYENAYLRAQLEKYGIATVIPDKSDIM